MYEKIRSSLFRLDPERAHDSAIAALRLLPRSRVSEDQCPVEIAGLHFPNAVGLAAGFDKNAQVPDALLSRGFGSVEVGTVTPFPQAGNAKPRLFRLEQDRAIINRMGFNNAGLLKVHARLQKRADRPGIVGANIGANKDSENRIADYALCAEMLAPYVAYLTVNVSSPNTPGLRKLQDAENLAPLLDAVIEGSRRRDAAVPVFLKVAPDLEPKDIDAIARLAIEQKLSALIISNTTVSRPALHSPHAHEAGGLSGAPLRDLGLQRLRDFRKATGGQIPLIGVGGILEPEDAWQRIRAGASMVQLYTALIYGGPNVAHRMVDGIARAMKRDGFSTIAEAVGTE